MVGHALESFSMKVSGPSGPSAPATARTARSSGGFSVPQAPAGAPAAGASAASGWSGLTGVSALMALQGVEDVMERRRRAIRRGGGLLDRLEDPKMALLSGEADHGPVAPPSQKPARRRPSVEGPALNGLLDEIDLRAAVELAKADLRRAAA